MPVDAALRSYFALLFGVSDRNECPPEPPVHLDHHPRPENTVKDWPPPLPAKEHICSVAIILFKKIFKNHFLCIGSVLRKIPAKNRRTKGPPMGLDYHATAAIKHQTRPVNQTSYLLYPISICMLCRSLTFSIWMLRCLSVLSPSCTTVPFVFQPHEDASGGAVISLHPSNTWS